MYEIRTYVQGEILLHAHKTQIFEDSNQDFSKYTRHLTRCDLIYLILALKGYPHSPASEALTSANASGNACTSRRESRGSPQKASRLSSE